jgi:hypothetical protein
LNSFFDPAYLNAGFQSPITGFMPWGSSTYHGLQTQLTRRMTNGLQFQVAYTFSHALDNSTADFFSTIVAPRRPQNFRDLHSEWSSSPLDHRHRVTLQALYDVPWFKNSNWFMKNILGNYEFAPVYIYETGQWGTVQSGVDSNLNADSAPDRAIFNPNGVPGTGSGVTPLTNSNGDIVAYLANNPNAQYIVAGLGALANSGRDTLRTPPINNWDVTLAKHFNITERQRVDFSFGMFNAFNHPQFTTGSLNQVNSISRTSTGERNFFIPNKSNFDNPKLSWPSNARTAVVALRYSF